METKNRPTVFNYLSFWNLALLASLFLVCLVSCQTEDSSESTERAAANRPEEAAIDSARLSARRPAPEYYILTPEIHKNRVYICDDPYSDVFHTKYECEVLSECTSTKKNVTLVAAIRDNGRYNCETCSAELGHIFDEEMIRGNH